MSRPGGRAGLALGLLAGLAVTTFLLHIVVAALQPAIGYEFHRDELLYLAMGKRMALFGMESAPGIAIVAALERALLGESVLAIRAAPAAAGAAIVFLAGWTAREMGGGRWAQGLAATAVLLPTVFLRTHTLFQPVVFDQLAWTAAAAAIAWTAARDDPRGWAAVGAALGFGLLFKPTALLWGFALLVGTLATARRRDLATRWPWIGAAVALFGALPFLVGQVRTGWPFFEQTAVVRGAQTAIMDRGAFLLGQVMFHWPSTLVAVVGVGALLFARPLGPWRILGIAWATAFATLFALAGKAYYLTPAYPPAFAAGAVTLGAWTAGARHRALLRGGIVALLVLLVLPLLPLGLPVLPPPRMAAYAERLGIESAVTTNEGAVLRLPQDYADMLGWREQAEAVARVWRSLPAGEREEGIVAAANYGEAGALDLYGPHLGLPEPVSPVSAFWRWGLHGRSGHTAVVIGADEEGLRELYAEVVPADTVRHPWTVDEEREVVVWIARDPLRPIEAVWPDLRRP